MAKIWAVSLKDIVTYYHQDKERIQKHTGRGSFRKLFFNSDVDFFEFQGDHSFNNGKYGAAVSSYDRAVYYDGGCKANSNLLMKKVRAIVVGHISGAKVSLRTGENPLHIARFYLLNCISGFWEADYWEALIEEVIERDLKQKDVQPLEKYKSFVSSKPDRRLTEFEDMIYKNALKKIENG